MNQKQKSVLSKIFAISGAVFLWGPILFLFVSAIWSSIRAKSFLFDYFTLAELFPIVALGLVLLVLASLVARIYAKWFGWGSVAALVALASGQIYATVSGLASGAIVSGGSAIAIVIASIIVFNLMILGLAILGAVLVRRLYSKKHSAPAPTE
ncbi:MAG: hypothetical protein VB062_03925 [Christensenella sp.]|nr:hypothetical protein [Christensenella sp.]